MVASATPFEAADAAAPCAFPPRRVSLDNLGGVYVGDRTKVDPSFVFYPTPGNIKSVGGARCLWLGSFDCLPQRRRRSTRWRAVHAWRHRPALSGLHRAPFPRRYLPNATEITQLPAEARRGAIQSLRARLLPG